MLLKKAFAGHALRQLDKHRRSLLLSQSVFLMARVVVAIKIKNSRQLYAGHNIKRVFIAVKWDEERHD
ncbi:hypothetical protein AAULR_15894, partial [Lacticaseibacillus rhamnosus MTCC 5462]